MVVAALLHDIGDMLAPLSHSEMAAAVLRPFVTEKTYWIIKHHGMFQTFYYAHHRGGDRNPGMPIPCGFARNMIRTALIRSIAMSHWNFSSPWSAGCFAMITPVIMRLRRAQIRSRLPDRDFQSSVSRVSLTLNKR